MAPRSMEMKPKPQTPFWFAAAAPCLPICRLTYLPTYLPVLFWLVFPLYFSVSLHLSACVITLLVCCCCAAAALSPLVSLTCLFASLPVISGKPKWNTGALGRHVRRQVGRQVSSGASSIKHTCLPVSLIVSALVCLAIGMLFVAVSLHVSPFAHLSVWRFVMFCLLLLPCLLACSPLVLFDGRALKLHWNA